MKRSSSKPAEGPRAGLIRAMGQLAAPQRKLLLRALSRPPRKGESRCINLGFGSLEWKLLKQRYGPYAYLRVWGEGRHHSFYLGGALRPRTADLDDRLAEWIGGGAVGQRQTYRAMDFPAGRRERAPGRKANLQSRTPEAPEEDET